jgi:hypothetical protein
MQRIELFTKEEQFDHVFGKYSQNKNKYQNINRPPESILMVIVYDVMIGCIINEINLRRKTLYKVKNNIKKQRLIDQFDLIMGYIEKTYFDYPFISPPTTKIVGSVFIVDDDIREIYIPLKWRSNLSIKNVDKIIFRYDNIVNIEYLHELLTNS